MAAVDEAATGHGYRLTPQQGSSRQIPYGGVLPNRLGKGHVKPSADHAAKAKC